MTQRIRYIKKDNKLISLHDVVSKKGSKYQITIDLENMNYVIKNTLSHRKYAGGKDINNLNVLKRKIKAHLKYLGVEFSKEKRNRCFGLVPKGYTQEQYLEEKKKQQEQNTENN